jgi:hypothetical protein
MATVTTIPGSPLPVIALAHRHGTRAATPRGRRTSPTVHRRRRVVLAALAVGAVVVAGQAGAALGGSPLGAPGRSPTLVSSRTIVVRPGDTLWAIAERIDPGADPRPVVDELVALNGSSQLQPGETLRAPA